MYEYLSVFYVYAFLGWCTEVCYAALIHGTFINRGFLNGPVCPIYGFGAVFVLSWLEPLSENWLLLFLGSVFLTSLLELMTGFALEKIFRQQWWDYSKEPFNLGGYICLRFSILWGFACVFVVKILHPTVLLLVQMIPHTPGLVLLSLSSLLLLVDLTATVRTIARLRRRQSQVDELAVRIRVLSNSLGENLAGRVMDAAETGAEWRQELSQRAESLKEHGEGLREELSRRRFEFENMLPRSHAAVLRSKAVSEPNQKELEELRRRVEQLRARPVFGQLRLMSAFPKMGSALRGLLPEQRGSEK